MTVPAWLDWTGAILAPVATLLSLGAPTVAWWLRRPVVGICGAEHRPYSVANGPRDRDGSRTEHEFRFILKNKKDVDIERLHVRFTEIRGAGARRLAFAIPEADNEAELRTIDVGVPPGDRAALEEIFTGESSGRPTEGTGWLRLDGYGQVQIDWRPAQWEGWEDQFLVIGTRAGRRKSRDAFFLTSSGGARVPVWRLGLRRKMRQWSRQEMKSDCDAAFAHDPGLA